MLKYKNIELMNKVKNQEHYYGKFIKLFNKIDLLLKENIIIIGNSKKYPNFLSFIDKKTKSKTIFLNSGIIINKVKKIKYHLLTVFSLNPKYYKISNKNNIIRFNYINNRYFTFNHKYKINIDGNIVIYLNNIGGWFQRFWRNGKNNLTNNLLKLISEIKKHNIKNKIKIRFHPKNRNSSVSRNIMKEINKKYNDIEIDNSTNEELINKPYCVFIQNAKIIFDLVNKGIPLFNHKLISCNYFNNIYIELKNINNLSNIILPERKKWLIENYCHLIFEDEFEDNFTYLKNLFLNL